jgi:hypothetical protein
VFSVVDVLDPVVVVTIVVVVDLVVVVVVVPYSTMLTDSFLLSISLINFLTTLQA